MRRKLTSADSLLTQASDRVRARAMQAPAEELDHLHLASRNPDRLRQRV
jgi:hypothetical protein